MVLSIIIVSWNVRARLQGCLQAVQETVKLESGLKHEVFVVDNASVDGSAEMVAREFPEVHLINNPENAGFAKANNAAIKLSQGRYILLLNPDMQVLPGTLMGMVRFLEEERNAEAGVAGCWLLDAQGNTLSHVRRFPGFQDQLAILLKIPHFFPGVLDAYLMKNFDYSKEAQIDTLRGSFFMVRRKVFEEIGLLDEQFFLWYEEVDFCKRAQAAGWRVAYNPAVQCVDYVGQSFKQVRLYSKQKVLIHSMLYYFKKHQPLWQYGILWTLRPFALAAVWVGDKLNMKASRVT